MSNNSNNSSITAKQKQRFTNQKSCPAFFSTSCHDDGENPCLEMESTIGMENNNLNEAKDPGKKQCQKGNPFFQIDFSPSVV